MKRLALLCLGVIAAAAAVAVVVSTDNAQSAEGRVIRLVEKGGTSGFVDNAPKGSRQARTISAGDFSAGVVKLFHESGRNAGTLHAVCVATVSGPEVRAAFQCAGTIKLATGTLALNGLIQRRPTTDLTSISVTGGTGAYEGARGFIIQRPRPRGTALDEIHLLP
jgi:hypothetical protein